MRFVGHPILPDSWSSRTWLIPATLRGIPTGRRGALEMPWGPSKVRPVCAFCLPVLIHLDIAFFVASLAARLPSEIGKEMSLAQNFK